MTMAIVGSISKPSKADPPLVIGAKEAAEIFRVSLRTWERILQSDINLTMNVYTKVSSEDDAKAVAAMPKLSAS